jgi:hypothetical protein
MLRKVAIVLIFIYMLPNLGFGINLHWCGKHLASFSINSISQLGCSCEEFDGMDISSQESDDCCKEEFAFFKLNTTHMAGKELLQIGAKSVLLLFFSLDCNGLFVKEDLPSNFFHNLSANVADPPGQPQLCVFRV